MSVTDGIGHTPCSFEHYLVINNFIAQFQLNTSVKEL